MRIGIVHLSLVVSQGSERGALPEVVSNVGFYVPYGDEKTTAEVIKKVLNSPNELRKSKGADQRYVFNGRERKGIGGSN